VRDPLSPLGLTLVVEQTNFHRRGHRGSRGGRRESR